MQYVTTDNCSFSCTTSARLFIARATFSHRCPSCGGEETGYNDGFPLATLTRSAKHIQVLCSHCNRVYFPRITCTLDLCQVYHDRGFDFADNSAHAWGLTIGALKEYVTSVL